jgi:acyl-coenzyme A synthetase/AMP-(fatty) acid ligase
MYLFLTDEEKAEAVRNFVIEKTGLNSAAFKTIIIDEIPKNDAGKTLYRKLEKYYD